ncbi:TetR family transcriptional regulator [Dactylosporangium sp. NPDC051541]|uniref:TetR family transcriptional regulator n=1 Tax=Dactylosporangium sp. NPDC051541 TaxID=3363977 RepID=UPI00378A3443
MTTRAQPAGPATAKGEATRAFLLRTAAQVFAERGYLGTSLSDLIAASGLTKGAFYFYFSSKAALALAVLHDQQARWLRQVSERVLAHATAVEQFEALTPAMLELLDAEPGAWSVSRLSRDMASDPALAGEVSKPMAEWVGFVADLVRRGQAAGDLRAGLDPQAVAAILVGAFDGLKSLTDVLDPGHEAGERFTTQALVLLDLVRHGLLTERAG